MPLPLVAKVGFGMVALGGTGIVGWQIVSYINTKDTISSYLANKGRKLASSEDEWKKLSAFYKAEKSDAILGLEKEKINHTNIKNWCVEKASKSFKEASEKDLLLIESWCSEPKTLLERISSLGKRKLSTESDASGDQAIWTAHKETYKIEGDNYKIQQNNSSTWTDVEKNSASESILKTWCLSQEGKHYKHEKDTLFKTYDKWCVVNIKPA